MAIASFFFLKQQMNKDTKRRRFAAALKLGPTMVCPHVPSTAMNGSLFNGPDFGWLIGRRKRHSAG